jgi:hypothetical protein
MTRKLLALLVASLIIGVLAPGCVVHDKEKVKEVKTTDSGTP